MRLEGPLEYQEQDIVDKGNSKCKISEAEASFKGERTMATGQ